MADFYGLAGLFLILFGWCVELLKTIAKRQSQVPLSFALLYGAGSLLLTLHSMELGDMVFMALNAAAALIAAVNVAFSLAGKRK